MNETESVFEERDLDSLHALGEWLQLIEDDADTREWSDALVRVVSLALAVNEALPQEVEYQQALERALLRQRAVSRGDA